MDEATGEVCDYKRRDSVSTASVNRSFGKLHRLIVGNFSEGVMVTLTVAGDYSADPSSLYRYFNQFYKKMKYHLSDSLEYLAVLEPHRSSGRFHYHVLYRARASPHLTLDPDKLSEWWGVGAVNVRRIFDVNGLALYLTSKKKRQAWGSHHCLHAKLYRTSRGIARPTTMKLTREELEKYVTKHQFNFAGGHVYKIKRDNGDGTVSNLNSIVHERFDR